MLLVFSVLEFLSTWSSQLENAGIVQGIAFTLLLNSKWVWFKMTDWGRGWGLASTLKILWSRGFVGNMSCLHKQNSAKLTRKQHILYPNNNKKKKSTALCLSRNSELLGIILLTHSLSTRFSQIHHMPSKNASAKYLLTSCIHNKNNERSYQQCQTKDKNKNYSWLILYFKILCRWFQTLSHLSMTTLGERSTKHLEWNRSSQSELQG